MIKIIRRLKLTFTHILAPFVAFVRNLVLVILLFYALTSLDTFL